MIPRLSACPCCSLHRLAYGTPPRRTGVALVVRPQRGYATIQDSAGDVEKGPPRAGRARHRPAALPWPTSHHPTPYEIFHQTREAPYQKARFYDLVKLYHPDHHHHLAGGRHDSGHGHGRMSAATLLERYRLVVAANEILRSPSKRRAYDLYGAGWAGGLDSHFGRYGQGAEDIHAVYRRMDKEWRTRPGSAANNATWEDWERWRARQANGGRTEEQELQFTSNASFVMIVLFCMVLAGFAQVSRAGSSSLTLLETQERRHDMISRNMAARQLEYAALSRQDRVGSFLERREGWYDLPVSSLLAPRRSDKEK